MVSMIKIVLSRKLGELRLKQADLQRATGIRPSTISDWYNDVKYSIDLEHLDLICEALDCEISDILVREPNREPAAKKAERQNKK